MRAAGKSTHGVRYVRRMGMAGLTVTYIYISHSNLVRDWGANSVIINGPTTCMGIIMILAGQRGQAKRVLYVYKQPQPSGWYLRTRNLKRSCMPAVR
ncbi:hypothetical protein BJV78DRAFT_1245770 [Lactifluus subvellereus]|nr:hypothetical protein BJV78DRAFT_1245770 [Lactifluus subvellereus]